MRFPISGPSAPTLVVRPRRGVLLFRAVRAQARCGRLPETGFGARYARACDGVFWKGTVMSQPRCGQKRGGELPAKRGSSLDLGLSRPANNPQ